MARACLEGSSKLICRRAVQLRESNALDGRATADYLQVFSAKPSAVAAGDKLLDRSAHELID
jgi:hypothetical protein